MDLNTASLREFVKLPGIGPVIGQRIADARPFTSISELQFVNGVGTKRYLALVSECLVCVGSEKQEAMKKESSQKKASVATNKLRAPLVNLNSASTKELCTLQGVGPVLAQRIVAARPFRRKDEITAVCGIGLIIYEKMRHQLQDIGGSTAPLTSSILSTSSQASEGEEEGECRDREADKENQTRCVAVSSPLTHRSIECHNVLADVRSCVIPHLRSKLLIASWNIRNLSKRRDAELLDRIISILSEYDLVALQEVRDTIVLKRLKNLMPGWDYIASPLVGLERAEHFVFFYRRSAVAPVGKGRLDGPSSRTTSYSLVRPPFIATFKTLDPSVPPMQITLVNVHVVCGDHESRLQEIEELRRLTMRLQAPHPLVSPNDKLLIMGDFNLAPHDIGRIGNGDHQFDPLVLSPLSTTVASNLYDNIWMNSRGDWDKLQMESGVQRVDWAYFPASRSTPKSYETRELRQQTHAARVRCTHDVSDHCPVFLALGAAWDDREYTQV